MHEPGQAPAYLPDDDLLAEACRVAMVGPVSAAGRCAYLGATAAAAGPHQVTAGLLRLARQDHALGVHALAAGMRAATDEEIRRAAPDIADDPPQPAAPRPRHDFRTRTRA